jgi:preprotein translocase subunit SecA
MNQQREVVYEWRNDVLNSNDTRILINEAVEKGVRDRLAEFIPQEKGATPNYEGLIHWINITFPVGLRADEAAFETRDFEGNVQYVKDRILGAYDVKVQGGNPTALQEIEKMILLNAIDRLWQEHLYALDALKEGVSLRSHGQKDPLIEFKQEAFGAFASLMTNINGEVLGNLFRSTQQLAAFEAFLAQMAMQAAGQHLENEAAAKKAEKPEPEAPSDPAVTGPRLIIPSRTPSAQQQRFQNVGRNDPCPCGSGKKYKQCCGRTA